MGVLSRLHSLMGKKIDSAKLQSKIDILFRGDRRSVTVKKNILGSFALKGISILISFFLVPVTIGYINAELYGVWLTVASVMTWLHFMDLGFTQGLKNRLTEALAYEDYEKGRSLVSTTYLMLIVIFIPLCVILELIIPSINWTQLLNVNEQFRDEVTDVMRVVIAIACLQMVVNVIVSVIAAFQQVALSNSFSVIGNVISLVIILIIRDNFSPSLIVLALTLGSMPTLVTIVASFICYGKSFKKVAPRIKSVNRAYIKDLFSLGYKFFIINIQLVVLYWSTNVLISHVSSPIEVTKYNIAYQLINVAMLAYTIIISPLWPAYTDAYARNDFVWMKNTRKRMISVLLTSVLGCLTLVALANPIYKIWIGDSVDIPFLMTFMVALYVMSCCWMNLNGTLIVGMGKIKVETIMVVVGMFVHIPFSLYLGRHIGAYGVIVSLILINVFYAIVMNLQVNMLLNKRAYGIWNK